MLFALRQPVARWVIALAAICTTQCALARVTSSGLAAVTASTLAKNTAREPRIVDDAVVIDSAGETIWEDQTPTGPALIHGQPRRMLSGQPILSDELPPQEYSDQGPFAAEPMLAQPMLAQPHPGQIVNGAWPGAYATAQPYTAQPYSWQLLPSGLIYQSYLAGVKESRFAGAMNYSDDRGGWLLDVTLGGRAGIIRYGTEDNLRPEGWQLDIEGAAFPRIDLEADSWDMESSDFRFGVPLTYGRGAYQMKIAYYHLSSHAGDEYLINNNIFTRINFSRDVLVWGHSLFVTDDFRIYGEAGWAYQHSGGTEPLELQFGFEYSPAGPTGVFGTPFFAANGHLREELDFGGNAVVQAGLQWRGITSTRLLRAGVQYYSGYSAQYQFFRQHEELIGLALWYDY